MFSASTLTEQQTEDLRKWAQEGASIADLQRRLKEAHGISITYMDARFLVLDLGITIQEPKEEEKKEEDDAEEELQQASDEAGGGVSVSMDHVAVPGALASGRVRFADGEGAAWMIDQYGRPGLEPDRDGYRPSKEDLMEFQTQLGKVLEEAGF